MIRLLGVSHVHDIKLILVANWHCHAFVLYWINTDRQQHVADFLCMALCLMQRPIIRRSGCRAARTNLIVAGKFGLLMPEKQQWRFEKGEDTRREAIQDYACPMQVTSCCSLHSR